jgi:hypothetical protein
MDGQRRDGPGPVRVQHLELSGGSLPNSLPLLPLLSDCMNGGVEYKQKTIVTFHLLLFDL